MSGGDRKIRVTNGPRYTPTLAAKPFSNPRSGADGDRSPPIWRPTHRRAAAPAADVMMGGLMTSWERVPTAGWRLGADGEVIVLAAEADEAMVLTGPTAEVWLALEHPATAEELLARVDLPEGLTGAVLEPHLGALVEATVVRTVAGP